MAIQKLSFQWDIKNFCDCDLVSNEFVHSATFSTNDPTLKSDWTLRLYPAGFNFEVHEILGEIRKNLTILLLRLDSGSVFHTKHSISFLDRTGCRIQTKNCSEICESSRFTIPPGQILELKNIVEIDGNFQKLLDGGVLTILCEMEIFENIDEIQPLVPDIQMRGISWVISNVDEPIVVNLVDNAISIFNLSYGKIFVRFQCGIELDEFDEYRATFQIIDKNHPKIKEVPITIFNNNNTIKSTWNIQIHPTSTVPFEKPKTSLQISSRCMIESKPYAVPFDLTPHRRKMQLQYRKMFSHSDGGGDVTIAVDGRSLRVHKNILSNRCPVFATMFGQDQWLEQATQTVNIKDFDYKTILAMIEFIYFGGSDDWYEAVDPADLLKAAHMYQLDDLRIMCELRLCSTLETENIFRNLALAETYELLNLKSEVFDFISNNQIGQTDKKYI